MISTHVAVLCCPPTTNNPVQHAISRWHMCVCLCAQREMLMMVALKTIALTTAVRVTGLEGREFGRSREIGRHQSETD